MWAVVRITLMAEANCVFHEGLRWSIFGGINLAAPLLNVAQADFLLAVGSSVLAVVDSDKLVSSVFWSIDRIYRFVGAYYYISCISY